MKVLVLLLTFVVLGATALTLKDITDENGMFKKTYNNIKVDLVFKNNRLLNTYVDCLKGKKKCNIKEGQFLKGEFLKSN